ncbi:MAG TPA: enoyl-CoA hydratase-related protein, partial [Gemmatimonadales bacterium]
MTAFSLSQTDGIAVLTLDVPGESVNMLGTPIIEELEALLRQIADDAGARAVVLISGKAENFVAGADIQEFTRIGSAEAGAAMARAGQEMIGRLERFPKP